MLTLSRKAGERIVIGKPGDVLTESIIVTICDVRSGHQGQNVRVGVDAQRSVDVHRYEVAQAIAANHAAGVAALVDQVTLELGAIDDCEPDFPAMGVGSLGQIGDVEQAIHKAAMAVRETVRNLEAD